MGASEETGVGGASQEEMATDPRSPETHDRLPADEAASVEGWRLVMVERLPGLAMLGLFGVVVLGFTLAKPDSFGTLRNAKALISQNAIVSIAALAVMMPLITREFDISFAALIGLSNVLVAGLTSEQGLPLWLAIVVVLGVGLVVGTLHSLLVLWLKLDSLVVTLGTSSVLTGLVLWYTGGRVISENLPESLLTLGSGTLLGLQYPVFVMLAVVMVLWFSLEKPPWGRHLYAAGEHREAARLRGLPTTRLVASTFIIASITSSLAGILLAARNGVGHPTAAGALLLPAFAAAFLGTAAFRIGQFNAWGTVLAVFLLAVGVNGLKFLGAPFWVDNVFNGIALIVAIGLARLGRTAQLSRTGR